MNGSNQDNTLLLINDNRNNSMSILGDDIRSLFSQYTQRIRDHVRCVQQGSVIRVIIEDDLTDLISKIETCIVRVNTECCTLESFSALIDIIDCLSTLHSLLLSILAPLLSADGIYRIEVLGVVVDEKLRVEITELYDLNRVMSTSISEKLDIFCKNIYHKLSHLPPQETVSLIKQLVNLIPVVGKMSAADNIRRKYGMDGWISPEIITAFNNFSLPKDSRFIESNFTTEEALRLINGLAECLNSSYLQRISMQGIVSIVKYLDSKDFASEHIAANTRTAALETIKKIMHTYYAKNVEINDINSIIEDARQVINSVIDKMGSTELENNVAKPDDSASKLVAIISSVTPKSESNATSTEAANTAFNNELVQTIPFKGW